MADKKENLAEVLEPQSGHDVQHIEETLKLSVADQINQGEDSELYLEAIQRYPNDEAIDKEAEKRLKRKLDMHLIPLLAYATSFTYVGRLKLAIFRSQLTSSVSNSMSTKRHFRTQQSLASKMTSIFPVQNTRGCQVSSTLDG